jgi:hypothetical protein
MHEKAVASKFGEPAIVSPAEAPASGRLKLCAECHGHHQEASLPRTDPYWIRFQGTTLTWSRCFTESQGGFDCMTCHDPHKDADRSEQTYTTRCLGCHAASSAVAPSAPATPPTSAGSPRRASCPVSPARGCIGCHMPPFRSEALHATFADHFIRVHPRRDDQSLK